MTQQIINIGAAPDDSTGDPLRLSFDKTNENFTELYAKGATEGLWNYNKTSTDTTTAPVSGRFKTNSGDYRGATQIAINAITIQGIDRSSTLRTLLVGDLIQCQDSTNSAAWCRYSLQSLPVDHGTWFQLNVTFQTDGGVASGDNQEVVFIFTASSGSAAVGAPVGAEYITSTADATLTAERVLTNTPTITWDFSTPGQAKASAAAGGNVSNSGTPIADQYAKWVTATAIQGVAPATVLSDIGAQPAGSYQPLDADLTAIAALTGTNAIYYRSAANTWAAVTVGTGLAFAGGTLSATATGNVSNSGTPTNLQLAQWTDATHIQGVAPEAVGASRVLLATLTPSGTVAVTIPSTVLTSAYDIYEIDVIAINATGATVALNLRVSTDGGTTFWAGASDYNSASQYTMSNATGGFTGASSAQITIATGQDSNANAPATGTIRLFNRASIGSMIRNFTFHFASYVTSLYQTTVGSGALLASGLPVNAIQIFWANVGNFGANSIIKVYGLR